ncbi:Na(+)/H(+) antiporter subunit C [Ancrocorticia populi]|uniref:Na(+)/H(+) antiporter subunit C n=1 Tax=Ancrocorticia populi TaxID=2175228 RepID=UPI003F9D0D83
MSSLALVILCGVLVAVGVYLILERSLSRIVLGIAAMSNGINILFLIAGGRSGEPPIVGTSEPEAMADPLVQAMMLTSIVITLSLTGFVLAMAYRAWQLRDNDEVRDDREDRAVAKRQAAEAMEEHEDKGDLVETVAEFHDETDGGNSES